MNNKMDIKSNFIKGIVAKGLKGLKEKDSGSIINLGKDDEINISTFSNSELPTIEFLKEKMGENNSIMLSIIEGKIYFVPVTVKDKKILNSGSAFRANSGKLILAVKEDFNEGITGII